MSFLSQLEKTSNKSAFTANGAISNESTLDSSLDYFSNAGAMRHRIDEAVRLFINAYAEDKQTAVRILFYLRDIRGGQGERSVFRATLQEIEDRDQSVATTIIKSGWIAEYGRYDDLLSFRSAESLKAIASFVKKQLAEDEKNMKAGKSVSLLAKWLPSENASSKTSRGQALALAELLGLKPRQYRQKVVALRKHIKLLEQKMSAREWGDIQYQNLPSQAHRKHVQAFKRHDESRYEKYLESVEKGDVKINSSTAYTYEIYDMVNGRDDRTANAMWKALPDWTNGENALVLPDVSGSMFGRPISVSVSLAVYFAERNKGLFKDYFLEFSDNAKLHKLKGDTLADKLYSVRRSTNWMGSTNLQSAFDAILKAAVQSNASVEEMPTTLYIISDMQFNQATYDNDKTNLEVAKQKFRDAGYELPHVVFWNVNSYANEAPATKYDEKVTLISGLSQSTFQYVVGGKSPLESMLDIIDSDRYNKIVL